MGKVHGSLARAGKVKKQTPKVAKAEKKKAPVGREKKRVTYNKRFLTQAVAPGMKRKANPQNVGQNSHNMGKVHGSLARAGKVKKQTPKVAKAEKKKAPVGREKKRVTYNKRFLTQAVAPGMKRKANPQNVGQK